MIQVNMMAGLGETRVPGLGKIMRTTAENRFKCHFSHWESRTSQGRLFVAKLGHFVSF